MDSSRAGVHDALRGRPGSHARLLEGLLAVRPRASGIELVINTVIMRSNYRELMDIVRLGESVGVRHFRFLALNYIYPYDMRSSQSPALALDASQIEELEGELERLIAWCESRGITLNSHRFLRGIPAFYAGRHGKMRCVAGYASISIHNDGRLSFCSSLPADIGNVRRKRLADIWGSPGFLAERARMMSGPCDKCYVSCFIEQNHWFSPGYLLGRLVAAH
jgi:MoaA/NifB/PqqE/SkfB family radical SAM enzyme